MAGVDLTAARAAAREAARQELAKIKAETSDFSASIESILGQMQAKLARIDTMMMTGKLDAASATFAEYDTLRSSLGSVNNKDQEELLNGIADRAAGLTTLLDQARDEEDKAAASRTSARPDAEPLAPDPTVDAEKEKIQRIFQSMEDSLRSAKTNIDSGRLDGAEAELREVTREYESSLNLSLDTDQEKKRQDLFDRRVDLYGDLQAARMEATIARATHQAVEPDLDTRPAAPAPRPPEPLPPGVREPTTPLTLDAARAAYLKAEKRRDDAKGILGTLKDIRGKTREKVQLEYDQAQAEYKRLGAEVMGASVENYLFEQDRLLEAKLDLRKQEERGRVQKAYDWYKGLSKYNLEVGITKLGEKRGKDWRVESKWGKRILRAVNIRTATSLALLGTGIGFGAGSAVGILAIGGRRVLSGAGSGVGFYDIANMTRRAAGRMTQMQADSISDPSYIEEYMASIESKILIEGKSIQDLNADQRYQELKKRRELLTRREFSRVAPEKITEFFDGKIKSTEKALRDKLKTEKRMRVATATVAAGIAAFVGSGGLARLFDHDTKLREGQNIGNRPAPTGTFRQGIRGGGAGVDRGPVGGGGAPPPVEVPRHVPGTTAPLEGRGAGAGTQGPSGGTSAVESGKPIVTVPEHPASLKYGASAEYNADGSLNLNAGTHGIEGAMRNLKDINDGKKFESMIKYLREHDYKNFKGNDDSLIHKWALDQSNGRDLNWVSKAVVHVDSNGHPTLTTVETIPDPTKHITHASETTTPTETSPAAPTPDQTFNEIMDKSKADWNVPNDPSASSAEKLQALKNIRHATDELRESNHQFDQQFLDMDKKLHEVYDTDSSDVTEASVTVAEKTSDGLKHLLGSEYKSFMNDVLHVSARSLNQIKDYTLQEFQSKWDSSFEFRKKYQGIGEFYNQVLRGKGLSGDLSLKQQIINRALEYKK